jgi:hypothetical protein
MDSLVIFESQVLLNIGFLILVYLGFSILLQCLNFVVTVEFNCCLFLDETHNSCDLISCFTQILLLFRFV